MLHNATLALDIYRADQAADPWVERNFGVEGRRQGPHFRTIDASKQMSASSGLAEVNSLFGDGRVVDQDPPA